ncbi:MAG: hypothetical protein HY064_07755 [Bacteroidetes bacterium]|nr:hypothetical protein [Bacteroidota bacterium]
MRFFIFSCTVFFLASCSSTVDVPYITSRVWVHNEGARVGDLEAMDFSKGMYECRHDTVFYSGTPAAKITALYKNDNLIQLKTIPKGEDATYLDQVEFTR